jgi:hypothetical protein
VVAEVARCNSVIVWRNKEKKMKKSECYANAFTKELHGPLSWALYMTKSKKEAAATRKLEDTIRPLISSSFANRALVALSHLLAETLQAAWNDGHTLFYVNTAECSKCPTLRVPEARPTFEVVRDTRDW